jgi:outer membrane receptor protein involved in Fe transport
VHLRIILVQACLAGLINGVAQAHEPELDTVALPEIRVREQPPIAASSQVVIPDREILLQPQGRPAQVLRLIPGFIAVEHSGGAGKADQYFLRGFDADHGTDVAFLANGMPINLRTHAHGQGYTDLNFIIPETIQGVDVYKGAYDPQFGDFATAGAVNFQTRESVREGVVQLAGGEFATQRHLLMLSPTKDKIRTLFATEGYYTNGPFINDNRYFRFNGLAKATWNPSSRSEASLTGTFHKAQWNASGEIPLRAVQDGTLDRFGAIDPSEGGKTTRGTGRLNFHYDTTTGGTGFANLYAQYYRLDLFTNFTFFKDDPTNAQGDGILQGDRRIIYGVDVGWRQSGDLFGLAASFTSGIQLRVDDIHARLAPQTKRAVLGTVVDSDIYQASYSPYLKLDLRPVQWLRLVGGVRGDVLTFDVRNRCPGCATQSAGRTASGVVTPKASMILGPWAHTEFFLNYGQGFHSNDARGVVAGVTPFARATSYEAGVRSKPLGADGLELIATLWMLQLQSELVLVGDQGTTVPRGSTRRDGVEVAARGQIAGPLYVNASVTWTHAEFRQTGNAIPLAPEVTAYGALLLRWPEGLSSQLQATYLGVRPLTEDRSLKAPSWVTVDLSERYQLPIKLPHGRLEAFLFIQNLLDTQWEQATFAFASRLPSESAPVTDIHFVPGTPRFLMGGIAWYF